MEEERVITAQNDDYAVSRRGGKHQKKKPRKEKKHKKLKVFLIIVSIILALILLVALAGNLYLNSLLNNNINRDETYNENELGVNENALGEDGANITNIALFGIDSRQDSFKGRSDSIIILSIDKERNKIKMTSLARDSYVSVDGHDKTKLGHAYAYGRAQLAVKTINQNFNMNITDYATVNFFGFAQMIDYIGGLDLNISESVFNEINGMSSGEDGEEIFSYEKLPGTGMQHLNGKQALSYARTRHHTGGDLARAGRQRDVLNASLKKAREMGIGQLQDLIKMGLQNCQTSLTVDEIKELGAWALLNSPTIETYAVPDSDCHPKSGKDCYIGKTWYYIYDIDIATQKIHDFITEKGTYKPN
ncbi:MAG: LCP family protein [Clostridiales bacterium]|nr:LCP family protein [Candidatus Equinaster intestinalis]